LGAHLTSAAINAWNFGALEQRLSLGTWQDVARRLAEIESHGSVYFLAIVALFASRRRWREAAVCVGLFLIAVLTFTNLHAHWYYAYANLVFLIAAVGLAIVGLLERDGWWRRAGIGLLALTVAVSLWRYQTLHKRLQQSAEPHLIHVAESVRRVTEPDEAILVLGDDWSSRIPYYAERRALMAPDWAEPAQFAQALENMASVRVGALVVVNRTGSGDWSPAQDPAVADYLRRFRLSSVASFSDRAVSVFPALDRAAPYEILRSVLRGSAGRTPAQVVRQLTRAVELAPRDSDLYRARAHGYLQLRNFDAALADCDRAAELGPREFEYQLDQATMRLAAHGAGQRKAGDVDELLKQALASAERAVALAPNQAAAYKIRGLVYDAMGQTNLAARDAATADDWLLPRAHLNNWGTLVIPQAPPPADETRIAIP
jgi:tetratricopeptide (TPR) repeat protein